MKQSQVRRKKGEPIPDAPKVDTHVYLTQEAFSKLKKRADDEHRSITNMALILILRGLDNGK